MEQQLELTTHEREHLKEEVRTIRREVAEWNMDMRDVVPTADPKGRRKLIASANGNIKAAGNRNLVNKF